MYATLFREHCHHVCCTFGTGSNGKNRLFLQKCPQAASVCKQKYMFLLVEILLVAPHEPIPKLYGKTRDLAAEEKGEVVEGTAVKE